MPREKLEKNEQKRIKYNETSEMMIIIIIHSLKKMICFVFFLS